MSNSKQNQNQNSPPSTLVIVEKNKAALAIAQALGSIQKIPFGKGLNVYFIPNRNIYVLPLRGHLLQYENTEEFKSWTTRDPRDIITDPNAIAKIPINYAGPFINALTKYAKLCTHCIIGTDADVEGCNIGLVDAFPFVQKANPTIHASQLWLNDLQPRSVQNAFQNLIPPKWTLAYAGEARAKIDAIIGFAATREVSLTLKPTLRQIQATVASIGRVQSSLLYLLYLREYLIRNFVPTPFWRISAEIILQDKPFTAVYLGGNFTDKIRADAIYQKIRLERTAIVQKITQISKQIPVPTPLNTSKALLLITSQLKVSANQAMKTLEDLYLNQIISYPRTDSDKYPAGFDHKSLLQDFSGHPSYISYAQQNFPGGQYHIHQGTVDAGDHPPITPLRALDLTSSRFESDLQRNVYDLIVRSYLALFGNPAQEIEIKLILSIKDEQFICSLNSLISQGFYTIAPFLAKKYDITLDFAQKLLTLTPPFLIPIKKINLEEHETQPAPRYNDTSLLKLMEQKNLGTKSTRPTIIQILETRGYIERKSRSFYVKELGFLLIDALVDIWKPFLDPQFTADVESELVAIQNGTKSMTIVIDSVVTRFLQLFDLFRQQKALIVTKMSGLHQTGNVIRGRNNQIIPTKTSSKKKEFSKRSVGKKSPKKTN